MTIQLSTSARNAQLDALETTVGTTPILRIRTGAMPASCATADSGTVLATMTLPSDWMAAAASGIKAKSGTWQDTSADATGTAGHYRIYDAGGTVCHVQGTVTITSGGGDMELDNTSIATGQTVTVSTYSWTAGNPVTIATYDQYIGATKQQLRIVKTAAATTIATVPFTTLDLAGSPGAGSLAVGNTANGLVPTDATAGFPSINTFGGGAVGYLGSVGYGSSVASRLTLFDRVFHVGSVVMTSLATTTLASQPSFASRLPGSLYENLELFLEVNAAVSATATTVSVGYTNESGTTGRSTGATASMSGYTTRRLVPMPLQAGDKGVQRIDSVTVGGTVATTGSVNVVVARRLWSGRTRMANDGGFDDINATGLPIVYDTSALWLVVEADSTSSGIPEMSFVVANG